MSIKKRLDKLEVLAQARRDALPKIDTSQFESELLHNNGVEQFAHAVYMLREGETVEGLRQFLRQGHGVLGDGISTDGGPPFLICDTHLVSEVGPPTEQDIEAMIKLAVRHARP